MAFVPVERLVLGIAVALVGPVYVVYRELRTDYGAGEYHLTWGFGIATRFPLGFVPGLGLYATVEKGYPIHWLLPSVVASLPVIGVVGYGADTATVAAATGAS